MKKITENFVENNNQKEQKIDIEKKDSSGKKEESQDQSKLDPTHFGDWQINCRAIDF